MILPLEENSLLVNGLYGAFDIVKKEDAEKIAVKEKLLLRGHLTRKNKSEEPVLLLTAWAK